MDALLVIPSEEPYSRDEEAQMGSGTRTDVEGEDVVMGNVSVFLENVSVFLELHKEPKWMAIVVAPRRDGRHERSGVATCSWWGPVRNRPCDGRVELVWEGLTKRSVGER